MAVAEHRPLGRTGLRVSSLGFGGAPLGNLFADVAEATARATIDAAWELGVRFFDTAPHYGQGLSERRIGDALRHRRREGFVLSTKVGRLLRAADPRRVDGGLYRDVLPFETVHDYSHDGIMRSVEDSLQRLGMDRVDLLLVHDLDQRLHGAAYAAHLETLTRSGLNALERLRHERTIAGFGAGLNFWQDCERLADIADVDCFLLAGRYTLLDQSALASFLPLCERRGIAVIVGGPYNTGILATGAVPGATYDYAPASPEVMARVGRIEAIARTHGVALASAALQFPLHHPAVAAVIPGGRSPAEVTANAGFLTAPIGQSFWDDLRAAGLIDPRAPTPRAEGEGDGQPGA